MPSPLKHDSEHVDAPRHIFKRDDARVLLVQQAQHVARFIGQGEAIGAGFAQRVERDAVAALDQHVRVANVSASPFACGDQLWRPYAQIVVGVDEVQRSAVEFDAARGASKRHPELLVEFTDVRDVGAIADENLVHAAGAEELEVVLILQKAALPVFVRNAAPCVSIWSMRPKEISNDAVARNMAPVEGAASSARVRCQGRRGLRSMGVTGGAEPTWI